MNEHRTPQGGRPPIVFTVNPLDRVSHLRKDEAWLAERRQDGASRFLPLYQLKAPVRLGSQPALDWRGAEDFLGLLEAGATPLLLGVRAEAAHFALDISALPEAPRENFGKFIDVRSIAPQLSPGDAGILAQARSLIDWHARHGFCPLCGSPTKVTDAGHSRRCTASSCGAQHFPRTDPVVIMLVLDGERCLLGRQAMFPKGMFSALAGFIEQGETIEDAVRREVLEEAGITVGAVRYIASQPWPFPSSLMLGCQASAVSRVIEVDRDEIEEAAWFTRAEVAEMLARSEGTETPRMPPALSLAHQLARAWVAEG